MFNNPVPSFCISHVNLYLKPGTHLAILYADRRDRRKSPGVPGAAIAIFADRRDRRIKSPISDMNWSQLSSAESCKDKFHIFITELQNAVDTCLPWKSVRIHPTDRPWTTKRIKMLIKSGKLHSPVTRKTPLPTGF